MVSASDPIPVFLLSGFLGAGKSTLLNDLLRDPAFSDTAIIINEFGDVPVDHLLVREAETSISQVATGCLCCSGTSDLRTTLDDLQRARAAELCPPFSRVIVEMSGLGDPAPLVNALAAMETASGTAGGQPVRLAGFHLAGFVTLYDILTGPLALENHFEAVKQIAFADRIVLTKTDLARDPASRRDLQALPAELANLNAGATIIDRQDAVLSDLFAPRNYIAVEHGDDVAGWLALETVLRAEGAHSAPQTARNLAPLRHGSGINTFSIVHEAPISEAKFHRFLGLLQSAAGPKLLRVKGLIAVANDPDRPRIIHAVQHVSSTPQVLETWPDDDHRTRIVFITNDIDPEKVRTIFTSLMDDKGLSVGDTIARLTERLTAPVNRFIHRHLSSQRTSP